MDVSLLRARFPLVIAHRGNSAWFPENTLPAFESAAALGADMVELDVALSADGHPVVFHDSTLERTTNGAGPLRDHTLAELRSLDAGSWKDRRFQGLTIPTLAEVLDLIGTRIVINIEIKGGREGRNGEIEARVLEAVRARDLGASVILSSFDYPVMERLRMRDGNIALSVLSDAREEQGSILSKVRGVGAVSYNPNQKFLDPALIERLHGEGIPLFPWAQSAHNRRETMKRLIEWGCDGFFANDPALLAELVHHHRTHKKGTAP